MRECTLSKVQNCVDEIGSSCGGGELSSFVDQWPNMVGLVWMQRNSMSRMMGMKREMKCFQ